MVKFFKFSKLLNGIEELIVNEGSSLLMKFVKILIMIFFISHWIACL